MMPRCLLAITLVALLLRVFYPRAYPWGFNEDELKHFFMAVLYRNPAIHANDLLALTMGIPWWLGASARWSIRGYSVVAGTLAVPMAYATTKALRCGDRAALVCAVVFATAPWALLYGRTQMGGELILHTLIVVWAIAHVLERDGRWWHTALGVLGATFLMYDYAGTRCAMYFPLLALPWATARGRVKLVAITLGALALSYPAWSAPGIMSMGGITLQHTVFTDDPTMTWRVLLDRAVAVVLSLRPHGTVDNTWMSIVHAPNWPWVALGLAALGVRCRTAWLVPCVVLGMSGAVFGLGRLSSHRMLAGLTVCGLLVACGADRVSRPTVVLPLVVALYLGVWGVTRYFSDALWARESRWVYCNFGCAEAPRDSLRGLPLRYNGRTFDD